MNFENNAPLTKIRRLSYFYSAAIAASSALMYILLHAQNQIQIVENGNSVKFQHPWFQACVFFIAKLALILIMCHPKYSSQTGIAPTVYSKRFQMYLEPSTKRTLHPDTCSNLHTIAVPSVTGDALLYAAAAAASAATVSALPDGRESIPTEEKSPSHNPSPMLPPTAEKEIHHSSIVLTTSVQDQRPMDGDEDEESLNDRILDNRSLSPPSPKLSHSDGSDEDRVNHSFRSMPRRTTGRRPIARSMQSAPDGNADFYSYVESVTLVSSSGEDSDHSSRDMSDSSEHVRTRRASALDLTASRDLQSEGGVPRNREAGIGSNLGSTSKRIKTLLEAVRSHSSRGMDYQFEPTVVSEPAMKFRYGRGRINHNTTAKKAQRTYDVRRYPTPQRSTVNTDIVEVNNPLTSPLLKPDPKCSDAPTEDTPLHTSDPITMSLSSFTDDDAKAECLPAFGATAGGNVKTSLQRSQQPTSQPNDVITAADVLRGSPVAVKITAPQSDNQLSETEKTNQIFESWERFWKRQAIYLVLGTMSACSQALINVALFYLAPSNFMLLLSIVLIYTSACACNKSQHIYHLIGLLFVFIGMIIVTLATIGEMKQTGLLQKEALLGVSTVLCAQLITALRFLIYRHYFEEYRLFNRIQQCANTRVYLNYIRKQRKKRLKAAMKESVKFQKNQRRNAYKATQMNGMLPNPTDHRLWKSMPSLLSKSMYFSLQLQPPLFHEWNRVWITIMEGCYGLIVCAILIFLFYKFENTDHRPSSTSVANWVYDNPLTFWHTLKHSHTILILTIAYGLSVVINEIFMCDSIHFVSPYNCRWIYGGSILLVYVMGVIVHYVFSPTHSHLDTKGDYYGEPLSWFDLVEIMGFVFILAGLLIHDDRYVVSITSTVEHDASYHHQCRLIQMHMYWSEKLYEKEMQSFGGIALSNSRRLQTMTQFGIWKGGPEYGGSAGVPPNVDFRCEFPTMTLDHPPDILVSPQKYFPALYQ